MHKAASPEPIAAGTVFADLTSWRKVAVSGSDALTWLNDLVSADISGLGAGEARRSLLLSPTGRIRAEFTVAAQPDATLLLQDPSQPAPVVDLLAKYILSSDVRLEDRTGALALLAFPDAAADQVGAAHEPADGVTASTPSCVGAGVDLLFPLEARDAMIAAISKTYAQVDADALDGWRVTAGIPRFGVDALEEDLPQEGGFGDAVAFDKGCYLGQEAMAKVRNLGHPRRTLLHLSAAGLVAPGDAVESDGRRVGAITSAAGVSGAWRVLAKVRWDAREAPLTTTKGVALG